MSSHEAGTGVIVWNSQTGEKTRSLQVLGASGVRSVAFSPDSRSVAVGSLFYDADRDARTGMVSLFEVESRVMKWKQAVGALAYPVALSPDGGYVVVRCSGQAIKYFAARNGWVSLTSHVLSHTGPSSGILAATSQTRVL